MVQSSDVFCALKWVFIKFFYSHVDIGFGSGDGGGFELGVEDEVGSNNGIRDDKYAKGEIGVEIGDSAG